MSSSGFAMTSSALWREFSSPVGGRELFPCEVGLMAERMGWENRACCSVKPRRCDDPFSRLNVKEKLFVSRVYAASNPRTAEKASDVKEASRIGQGQSKAKVKSKTLADAAREKKVVRDGFAGLSSLKRQLEQERPRISKGSASEIINAASLQKQEPEGRVMEVAAPPESTNAPERDVSSQGRNTSVSSSRDGAPEKLMSDFAKSRKGREGDKNPRPSGEASNYGFTWSRKSSQPSTGAHRGKVTKQEGKLATKLSSNSTSTRPARISEFSDSASDTVNADDDSADDGKLTGRSVMEALGRAAALREDKSNSARRKGRLGSDGDDEQRGFRRTDALPPFVFKSEWASQLQELEKDLENLRRVP